MGKASIGGPFSLVDTQGKRVSSEDFAGKYLLVYFGFTHCPDICPTELHILSQVTQALGAKKAAWDELIQPLFISIDPARDTPALIRSYLREFDPRIVGLTGTPAEVEAAAKKYKVFVYSLQDAASKSDDYILDHSIFIYLIGPDGKYIAHYGYDKTAAYIIDDVASYLPAEWYEFWL